MVDCTRRKFLHWTSQQWKERFAFVSGLATDRGQGGICRRIPIRVLPLVDHNKNTRMFLQAMGSMRGNNSVIAASYQQVTKEMFAFERSGYHCHELKTLKSSAPAAARHHYQAQQCRNQTRMFRPCCCSGGGLAPCIVRLFPATSCW